MKLQFKNQAFQEVASAAVRDVFEWRRGQGPRPTTGGDSPNARAARATRRAP